MQDDTPPPMNPLPPVIWALALPPIAVEVVVNLGASGLVNTPGADGWRQQAWERFAFVPDLWRAMVAAHQYPLDGLMRFISYPLVHGSFTHTLFVLVIFVALGKTVAQVFRWWAVVVLVFGATVAGAFAMATLPEIKQALIGGYPPVYGMIGAFTYLQWTTLGATGGNRARAFLMVGALLGVQVLFGLALGGGLEWVADMAGFATGFLLSFVLAPGGWRRVLERIRQR